MAILATKGLMLPKQGKTSLVVLEKGSRTKRLELMTALTLNAQAGLMNIGMAGGATLFQAKKGLLPFLQNRISDE
jgi:hypothetical protein